MKFIKKLFSSSNKAISVSEADSMLKRTNELANIANKTTDREEFYNSINEIKSILKELAKYEGTLPFIGSPSSDLRNLERIEQKQIELLEKRIEEKEKSEKFCYRTEDKKLDGYDEYFMEAGRFIIEKDKASIGMIQRLFKIGFNRASQIMSQLEEFGVIEPEEGTKPRKVLMTSREFENLIESSTIKKISNTNYCLQRLERIKELECIINSTIDEKEFATSLNELTNILYSLTLCENEMEFPFLPSDKLKMIKEDRPKIFDSFYQRREESNSIEKVDEMSGQEFEGFCAKLLEGNGFSNIEVTKGSGDHGIDILAEKDDITYAIQCKCYSSDIGNSAVQQAHTGKSIYKKDIAVVLTNRHFTTQAIEEAGVLGVKLWDRDKLNNLIKNIN